MRRNYIKAKRSNDYEKYNVGNAVIDYWKKRKTTKEENDFLKKYGLEEYIKTVEKGNKKTLDTTIRKYYV